MSENVLVIRSGLLDDHIPLGEHRCLITDNVTRLVNDVLSNHIFMPRDEAEYNYEFKQVIPYVIIRYNNDYLLLKRTTKQTEKRLHNKYSLGIGGHINPDPEKTHDNAIINGLYRELNEEISLDDPGQLEFVGVINDNSDSVSRVHVGFLYVLNAQSPSFEVLEKDKMTANWAAQERLLDFYNHLETWSRIVHDEFIMAKRNGDESKRTNYTVP